MVRGKTRKLLITVVCLSSLYPLLFAFYQDSRLIFYLHLAALSVFLLYQGYRLREEARAEQLAETERREKMRSIYTGAMNLGRVSEGLEPLTEQEIDARISASPAKSRRRFSERVSGISTPQKIISIGFFALLLTALVVALSVSHFIPDPAVVRFGLYLSLFLTVFLVGFAEYLYHRGLWRPTASNYTESALKHYLLNLPAVFAFMFLVFWFNFALTLPVAHNLLFGVATTERDIVEKKYQSGRYARWCRYELKPQTFDGFWFRYCIEREQFDSLPEGQIEAVLLGRKSQAGFWINKIEIERVFY